MSEVHSGAVGWLSLAAAPTFAIMALTGILGGGPGFMICPADQPRSWTAWSRCTC